MLNNNDFNGNGQVSYATFLLTKNGKKKELGFQGKTARTLLALLKAKNEGVRTLEAFEMGIHRFSGFICVLRHEYDINIITLREPYLKSWQGRYVLVDMVEIGKVFGSKNKEVFND